MGHTWNATEYALNTLGAPINAGEGVKESGRDLLLFVSNQVGYKISRETIDMLRLAQSVIGRVAGFYGPGEHAFDEMSRQSVLEGVDWSRIQEFPDWMTMENDA